MHLLIRFLLIVAVLTGTAYGTMKLYKFILDPHDYSKRNDFYKIKIQEQEAIKAKVAQNKALLKQNSSCDTREIPSLDKYVWEYTVARGDTLTSIAQKELGSQEKVDGIITLNKKKYPSLSLKQPFIEIGWTLKMPHKDIKRNSYPSEAQRVVVSNISQTEMSVIRDTPANWGESDSYDTTRKIALKDDLTYFGVSGPEDIKIGDCLILVANSIESGIVAIDASK